MTGTCRIIGVLDNGVDGLTPTALAQVRKADLIIGGARSLALLAAEMTPGAHTLDLTGQLAAVPGWVREAQAQGLQVVILATGDPLCHGIAGFLQGRLGGLHCEVMPNCSTVQLACARLGMAWQDLRIVSVHQRDTDEWHEGAGPEHGLYPVLRALELHDRIAILTSPENTPGRIARMLIAEGLGEDLHLAVAERLRREDERIVSDLGLAEAAQTRFADPNLMLLWRETPRERPVLFGLADETFLQKRRDRGLITKREVRALALARMQLRRDSCVWDIGAGSGSVGLEAARLCNEGQVLAIEKDTDDCEIAASNRRRLGLTNYRLTHGKAPAGLDAWPDPDAVFIGGSGGEIEGLIREVLHRLRPGGVLVMNLVTLEHLARAIAVLDAQHADWDCTQLQAARSQPVLDMHRLAAENPVWVLCARKPTTNEESDPD
jgi:precorrin-6Y C5,15-methyltransferase (decarboxylating)